FVCALAVRLLPWNGAASLVVVAVLLLSLLVSTFVPQAIALLVRAEHDTYLARAGRLGSTIIPLLGQTPAPLLTAASLDILVWLGRRGGWSLTRLRARAAVASVVSVLLVAVVALAQVGISGRAAPPGGRGAGVLIGTG